MLGAVKSRASVDQSIPRDHQPASKTHATGAQVAETYYECRAGIGLGSSKLQMATRSKPASLHA